MLERVFEPLSRFGIVSTPLTNFSGRPPQRFRPSDQEFVAPSATLPHLSQLLART